MDVNASQNCAGNKIISEMDDPNFTHVLALVILLLLLPLFCWPARCLPAGCLPVHPFAWLFCLALWEVTVRIWASGFIPPKSTWQIAASRSLFQGTYPQKKKKTPWFILFWNSFGFLVIKCRVMGCISFLEEKVISALRFSIYRIGLKETDTKQFM